MVYGILKQQNSVWDRGYTLLLTWATINDSQKDVVELMVVETKNCNTQFFLHLVKFTVIVTQGSVKHIQLGQYSYEERMKK